MNSNDTPPPPSPDRIRDLAAKLRRLAADPAATAAERIAAGRRLHSVMTRHGLTAADLDSDQLVECMLTFDHPADDKVVTRIIIHILNRSDIVGRFAKSWISFQCTPTDRADIMEAWDHYRPLLQEARAKANALKRAKIREANAIERGVPVAFVHKFRIFRDTRPDESARPMTAKELDAAMSALRAIEDIEGEAWHKKAGRVGPGQLQLAAG